MIGQHLIESTTSIALLSLWLHLHFHCSFCLLSWVLNAFSSHFNSTVQFQSMCHSPSSKEAWAMLCTKSALIIRIEFIENSINLPRAHDNLEYDSVRIMIFGLATPFQQSREHCIRQGWRRGFKRYVVASEALHWSYRQIPLDIVGLHSYWIFLITFVHLLPDLSIVA